MPPPRSARAKEKKPKAIAGATKAAVLSNGATNLRSGLLLRLQNASTICGTDVEPSAQHPMHNTTWIVIRANWERKKQAPSGFRAMQVVLRIHRTALETERVVLRLPESCVYTKAHQDTTDAREYMPTPKSLANAQRERKTTFSERRFGSIACAEVERWSGGGHITPAMPARLVSMAGEGVSGERGGLEARAHSDIVRPIVTLGRDDRIQSKSIARDSSHTTTGH